MKRTLAVLAALLFSVPALHATSINLTLNTSNENFALIGLGNDGAGIGQFEMDLGACVSGASTTTCTLSGRYSGATAGYTSGDYSISTTYANGDFLHAYLSAPGTSVFYVSAPSLSVYSVVTLNDDFSGTHLVTLIDNGAFVSDFNITYASSSCENLAADCNMPNVGATPGAVLEGPVFGNLSFNTPAATPEPGFLAFSAIVPLAAAALRRRS